MNGHFQEIFGSVIQAIGTIESAIGSTPSLQLGQNTNFNLRLQGNVLQATGNALAANGQGNQWSLETIGDEIQAFGNTTVIAGLLGKGKFTDTTQQKLNITGNWLQALGSLVGLTDEFEDSTPSGRAENIIGGLLQGIGNSLQAASGIWQLEDIHDEDAQFVNVLGSWIQAVGSVLSLIGQIKEEFQELDLGINE